MEKTKVDEQESEFASHEERTRESRRLAELAEQIRASAEMIREARGDGTRPQVVVTEKRWHSLANALDALVGLLVPEQAKDDCAHCPPLGMSLDTEAHGGVYRCGYCGKRWRGKAVSTGSMWYEVPDGLPKDGGA